MGAINSSHGIRSAEFAFAAFFEGTAHLLSTYAFDNPGIADASFRYYKEISTDPAPEHVAIRQAYADMIADNYEVTMLGDKGGTLAWVENSCTNDWTAETILQTPRDISSEIDWLRFWWQFMYHDDPGVPTAKPDLGDLRALLELAAQSTIPASGVRYPLLFSIMDDEANTELNEHVDRFDHFAQDNGVYNFATNP